MGKVWLVVTEAGEAEALSALIDGANQVDALAIGARSVAEDATKFADQVKWIETGSAAGDGFAQAAARVLEAEGPAAILGVSTPTVRAAIGVVIAQLGAPAVSNVISVSTEGDAVRVKRTDIDDRVVYDLSMPAPACLLVNPLSIQLKPSDVPADASKVEKVAAESSGAVEVLSVEPVETSKVETAKRIVSVGRGSASEGAFALAQQLADAIGAEMGCSMPVYKETGLLPQSVYIGLSGKHVSPDVYFALGISGVSHHTAGVRNAKVIVCVNKDPKAPFFNNSDYGIVGDVNEVIPELIRALG